MSRPYPWMHWTTRSEWEENMRNYMFIRRWRIRETAGVLWVEVPGKYIQDLALATDGQVPAGVIADIKPLPWWCCRLVATQWIRDF